MSKPFLRWAGGKSWLLSRLNEYLPQNINNYHEPFLGGGSIFLHLREEGRVNNEIFLSDLNNDLIEAYIVLRDRYDQLIDLLVNSQNDSEYYYNIRNSNPDNDIERAFKFIYLNRFSFNGIYRVNRKGEYNVPFGYRSLSTLFEYGTMRAVSNSLQETNLFSGDFNQVINNIAEGDLVFLDPPYTVAHNNNGFVAYNQNIFAWEDQIRLRDFAIEIHNRGGFFILTNAAHDSIRDLYAEVAVGRALTRTSSISGKVSSRKMCQELLFTNF